jgi:hypothetical protein
VQTGSGNQTYIGGVVQVDPTTGLSLEQRLEKWREYNDFSFAVEVFADENSEPEGEEGGSGGSEQTSGGEGTSVEQAPVHRRKESMSSIKENLASLKKSGKNIDDGLYTLDMSPITAANTASFNMGREELSGLSGEDGSVDDVASDAEDGYEEDEPEEVATKKKHVNKYAHLSQKNTKAMNNSTAHAFRDMMTTEIPAAELVGIIERTVNAHIRANKKKLKLTGKLLFCDMLRQKLRAAEGDDSETTYMQITKFFKSSWSKIGPKNQMVMLLERIYGFVFTILMGRCGTVLPIKSKS